MMEYYSGIIIGIGVVQIYTFYLLHKQWLQLININSEIEDIFDMKKLEMYKEFQEDLKIYKCDLRIELFEYTTMLYNDLDNVKPNVELARKKEKYDKW